MTDGKLSEQMLVVLAIVLLLAGCSGATTEPSVTPTSVRPTSTPRFRLSDIEVGMPKNDVIESLGKPSKWFTITPDGQASMATVFDLESTGASMFGDEVWLFEYSRSGVGTFTVHFRYDEVTEVVEGPVLED
jgi:hypothetical protein